MRRLSAGDRTLLIVNYTLLALFTFSTFYPFWNALVISFNTGQDTSLGGVTFWPRAFTTENYDIIFKDDRLLNAFGISVARTVVGTFASVLATAVFSYGMTLPGLMGRKFYMIFCMITMYFGGGLIPTYLLIRDIGLMNSFWVYIVPVLINVWNMIIFRTFFKSLPEGLQEAAKIDGAGHWGTLLRVVLPLSGPVVATLSLFTAVAQWNEWFYASIYIQNEKLLPVQTVLRQILNSNIVTENVSALDAGAQAALGKMQKVTSKSLSMAVMMVATLPIVCVYPFVQKHFVKGVLVGSLKE
ncbi:maltose ABC transporter permease [Cohnella xylanilytica]|uniref:Carbohydrate ABC transporter permease n=1 Tax=Cohnella xylanilytica TaxID=557555 RepID=A0A841U366_9BACL|nr:carbohydrate ABC transporter permease [Cohnella xylanilytica]MBB6692424.1 carbohydrate ABC transporter permease [Cohnella xylanilytica]GIO12557.1 maltose ABC transporter permease [Cohnella xylanilytica]